MSGIIESEQLEMRGRRLIKKSTAKESVENAVTVLKNVFGINTADFDIHINFPGGIPVDGPSAGIALVCAVYSAVKNIKMPSDIALTGEVSILGTVYAVGGVASKIEAAQNANIKRVIIPRDNYRRTFEDLPIEIICADNIKDVIEICFNTAENEGVYVPGEKLMIASASEANSGK